MEKITEYLIKPTVFASEVKAWEEDVLLPTYETGKEEKNPIFLEKRVYQGSSGAVYPYAVVEKILDEKKDKKYRAVFIENEYIKLMALPELGGRIQMAYDKVKKRHFVYYNQVVKPALVGLTGPWISGGIEFNWPQHHRPSTFLPMDFSVEEHADGSKTIWCSEVERMFGTKGMHGFRLYPGKAYVEVNVKIFNRTPLPQTFLWWANPAVAVHEHYYSVFPPDVHAVFDHGKRDVSAFPIATGTYYKQDYSAGVDISMYKNIPAPTSYMAIKSKYDFVGGYEANAEGGLLHVANHHVSPGKKQWTWGCGEFGKAWDRNLTDEDGPYIELMTGVFTDNQPDFSWLQPYEEKTWTQYFMPYAAVGKVKNATRDAVVGMELSAGAARVVLYAAAFHRNVRLMLRQVQGQKIYIDETFSVSPAEPHVATADVGAAKPAELLLEVFCENGDLLVRYHAEGEEIKPVPSPAKAAQPPESIASIEQLYLTGLHVEQYRHATYNPADYYREALRREPGDARCSNALGLWLLRRGQFGKAEALFRRAVATLTERNPNPYDGEPYYNLGWSLSWQGRYEEAYEAFFKSVWNVAWQDAGYFALAQIELRQALNFKNKSLLPQEHSVGQALELIDRCLIRNWHNHKARQLKASILRKLGRREEALKLIDESLAIDGFNMGARFEKYLLTQDAAALSEMNRLTRGFCHSYIEYALDFAAAGLFAEAAELIRQPLLRAPEGAGYPMLYYFAGYFAACMGDDKSAGEYYCKAEQAPPDGCFPNRPEEAIALQHAVRTGKKTSKASYYLANFWYAARQYDEAIGCWEASAAQDDKFPTVLRNLSLAYYNKRGDKAKALLLLEQAFALDVTDSRLLMEFDQLHKKLGKPHAARLQFLEKYGDSVEQRDDLCIERITLYNQLGQYEKAKALIEARKFHPWEGGEGKVPGQNIIACTQLAKQALAEKRFGDALDLLRSAETYAPNFGEGKLAGAEENDIHYFMACAYRSLGDEENAALYFGKATVGSAEPNQAFFYNDQQPDKIFYQGLAWRGLGSEGKARSRFNKLVSHGEKHLFDDCRIDYFAVSLPDLAIWEDDLNRRNKIHCYYVMGLGHLGLGNVQKAKEFLQKVVELDVNHQGAQIHLRYEV
ncbi:MAG: DUF5107 domain-containing protein [Prevotellaceae bacterium]|jgi:tetratricopeptide (TPR) repeat protein|nr:DUF5107 domain-containing protein [Prevotellaceae bacterium]